MIVAANHMGHAHVMVVDHHRQHIGRRAIGSEQDEIVEFGMLCGASLVSITLDADEPGGARLAIEVDALAGTIACEEALADRFDRIVAGLARQLRSTLDRESARGLYSIRIAVVGGGFSFVADDFTDQIEASVRAAAINGYAARLRVVRAGLGGDSPLIGAAALVHRRDLL